MNISDQFLNKTSARSCPFVHFIFLVEKDGSFDGVPYKETFSKCCENIKGSPNKVIKSDFFKA